MKFSIVIFDDVNIYQIQVIDWSANLILIWFEDESYSNLQ